MSMRGPYGDGQHEDWLFFKAHGHWPGETMAGCMRCASVPIVSFSPEGERNHTASTAAFKERFAA